MTVPNTPLRLDQVQQLIRTAQFQAAQLPLCPNGSSHSNTVVRGDDSRLAGGGGSALVTGIRKSSGAGSTDVAAALADILAACGTQNANLILAGPVSGGAATAAFRTIVPLDLSASAANIGYVLTSTGLTSRPTWSAPTGTVVGIPDLSYSPDATPASPSVFNDEFNGTSAATWTFLNPNGCTFAASASTGGIFTCVATPSTNITLYSQNIASISTGDFTFAVKGIYTSPSGLQALSLSAGMFLRNPTTGAFYAARVGATSATAQSIYGELWTNFTTFSGTQTVIASSLRLVYLRMRKVGTGLNIEYSLEGTIWITLITFTPASFSSFTQIGIWASPFANILSGAQFHWFRQTA